jgi:hypothetical protein
MAISCQISPSSLLGVLAGNYKRDLVDESVMIRTQMVTHNRSEMVIMFGMPCKIPPCNSNSKPCVHNASWLANESTYGDAHTDTSCK